MSHDSARALGLTGDEEGYTGARRQELRTRRVTTRLDGTLTDFLTPRDGKERKVFRTFVSGQESISANYEPLTQEEAQNHGFDWDKGIKIVDEI